MNPEKEEKAWREVKIHKRFMNAFRGMYVFYQTSRHFYVLILAAIAVIILGITLPVG